MRLPPEIRRLLLADAAKVLETHRPGPSGQCLGCESLWRRTVEHPCEPARIAFQVADLARPSPLPYLPQHGGD